MRDGETDITMVRRHIREGRVHIARQKLIIARFHAAKLAADTADKVLLLFQEMQTEHEFHLKRLLNNSAALRAENDNLKTLRGPSPWEQLDRFRTVQGAPAPRSDAPTKPSKSGARLRVRPS